MAIVCEGATETDRDGDARGLHGVLRQLRERGVPGFRVELLGSGSGVDRQLRSLCETELPFRPGRRAGLPALPEMIGALEDGRYQLVHAAVPPDQRLEVRRVLRGFYGRCAVVLSPSAAADDQLRGLGMPGARLGRWSHGVDLVRFSPRHRRQGALPGAFNVLHVGTLAGAGVDLLAGAFVAARAVDPSLHLVVVGEGPEEDRLRARVGECATYLGALDGEALAQVYASADMLLFAAGDDGLGQPILEAQASGLPVLAAELSGSTCLVEHRGTGWLCQADASALAAALTRLAAAPTQRRRLAEQALRSARLRSWDQALIQLGAGYRRALEASAGAGHGAGHAPSADADTNAVAGHEMFTAGSPAGNALAG